MTAAILRGSAHGSHFRICLTCHKTKEIVALTLTSMNFKTNFFLKSKFFSGTSCTKQSQCLSGSRCIASILYVLYQIKILMADTIENV